MILLDGIPLVDQQMVIVESGFDLTGCLRSAAAMEAELSQLGRNPGVGVRVALPSRFQDHLDLGFPHGFLRKSQCMIDRLTTSNTAQVVNCSGDINVGNIDMPAVWSEPPLISCGLYGSSSAAGRPRSTPRQMLNAWWRLLVRLRWELQQERFQAPNRYNRVGNSGVTSVESISPG